MGSFTVISSSNFLCVQLLVAAASCGTSYYEGEELCGILVTRAPPSAYKTGSSYYTTLCVETRIGPSAHITVIKASLIIIKGGTFRTVVD